MSQAKKSPICISTCTALRRKSQRLSTSGRRYRLSASQLWTTTDGRAIINRRSATTVLPKIGDWRFYGWRPEDRPSLSSRLDNLPAQVHQVVSQTGSLELSP